MNRHQLINEIEQPFLKEKTPHIRTGYTIRITQKIKDGDKERLHKFEGLVIKTHKRSGINASVTLLKNTDGVQSEKVFPLHSPSIENIEIIKIAKVRRSKLYYIKGLTQKASRMKETFVSNKDQ